MKVVVLKLGGTIHNGANIPGPIGEVLFIIKMLVNSGCEVHAYSAPRKRASNPIPGCELLDITDKNILDNIKNEKYDACIVINGSVNFFGGKDDPGQILNFRVMNELKDIPIFYCLTDWKLGLKPIIPMIKGRTWESNYNLDSLNIDECNINYISQLYNNQTNLDIIKKLGVTVNTLQYFPFEKFPLLKSPESFKCPDVLDFNERSIDILYVGSFRGGSRLNKMVEYFYNYPDDIDIHVRGTIDTDDFKKSPVKLTRAPVFGPKVPYTSLFDVLSTSKATICIGDPMYYNAGVSTRTYEAIMAKQVTFIDKEYDPTYFIYKNELLRKFCYVSNKTELIKKFRFLKSNPNLHKRIVELQTEETKIDPIEFSNDFVKLLKN